MAMPARKQDGLMVVELPCERLDAASADVFKVEVKEMIDRGERRIVLDFARVQFMDSSGLGAVVGCLKYMGSGGAIEIARPSPTVMKVLKLTRMDKVFKVRDLPVAQ